jgi:anaerobic magnesium-protoporphyrin IX monomethyl ester cyclase
VKVIISYPPLSTEKGYATLGQNRQFQYFKAPTYIYPIVPAQAATMLKSSGFEVLWNDCIAQRVSLAQFHDFMAREKPDVVLFESKTPVIKQHWRIINDLKQKAPGILCVLCGDHVTALPEESFQNSRVDFVLTGGDYDFLLLNLCKALEACRVSSPLPAGMPRPDYKFVPASLEPGIWYRDNGKVVNSGSFKLDHDLTALPFIDRELTQWKLYAFENGNYKKTPGTYMMSGRDCWYHACTFCSWPTLYPQFRARAVNNVLDETGELIAKLGVREIMDDTGCFPAGDWLRDFCRGFIARGFNREAYFDCNMRFGALSAQDFLLMKKANFRLLLFGLESANQSTLDRLRKGLKAERIIEDCRAASKAGLFPHITIMFGYPWEEYAEAKRTLALGTWLLKKGYAYTMQATLVVPYPGTRLFEECKQQGWLRTLDWDAFDMKQPVMRLPFSDHLAMRLVQGMYKVTFHPGFIVRKLFTVKDAADLAYYGRAAKKVFGHIFDFKPREFRQG